MGTWTPDDDPTEGDDTFTGNNTAENANGLGGSDTLNGAGGADTLRGGAGRDDLFGGDGDDLLLLLDGDSASNEIISGGAGYDTIGVTGNVYVDIPSSIQAVQFYELETGNQLILYSDDIGYGFSDELNINGSDSFDSVSVGIVGSGIGPDLSGWTYTNWADTDRINLFGNASANNLTGTEGRNTMEGRDGADTLHGGGGADFLSASDFGSPDGAADHLFGGAGDDEYSILEAGDIVVENADEGYDIVYSSIDYTLTANVDSVTLGSAGALSAVGNNLDNFLQGNSLGNRLEGLSGSDYLYALGGADTLDGGTSKDTLEGGEGDDTYFVDRIDDNIYEEADSGYDTVRADSDFVLDDNLEALILRGTADRDGTGNTLANAMLGNSGANYLRGLAGADTLTGGDGNDTIDGGADGDTMVGSGGNDAYYVNHEDDLVTEGVGGGADTVRSSITYDLTANVENLIITGSAQRYGAGNDLANTLTGNTAANKLRGFDANDTLNGGDGNDTLEGGAGADSMLGGSGDDTYAVDDTGDKVIDASGADTVRTSITYTLGSEIEHLTMAGTASRNGVGNALDNSLSGNSGDNSLSGRDGADTLNGGDGADRLTGAAGIDSLTGGGGADEFVLNAALSSANADVIGDFSVSDDTILLDNAVFTALSDGALAATAFYVGSSAHDGTDRIYYNFNTGALYYDSNGNASGGAVRIATLEAGLALTAADFLVI